MTVIESLEAKKEEEKNKTMKYKSQEMTVHLFRLCQ